MENNQNILKQIIADQLNIDTARILDVKKTWKNWVITMETCRTTDDDLVLVVPHDQLEKIDRLSTAIDEFSV